MEIRATFGENEMQMDGNFGEVMVIGDKDPFEGGAIQLCCACQTMITESTGKTIETKKSRVNAGTPVAGQYALYSNGIALVKSVDDNGDFTAQVVAYSRITINGEISTTKGIYAPTTAGTVGQMLVSGGQNKAPTWIDVPESGGSDEDLDNVKFCCYTQLVMSSSQVNQRYTAGLTNVKIGTAIVGQHVLFSNGVGEIVQVTDTDFTFIIKSATRMNLNNTAHMPTQVFYAPTSAGTAGQVLVSQGSNKAPVWKDLSEIS